MAQTDVAIRDGVLYYRGKALSKLNKPELEATCYVLWNCINDINDSHKHKIGAPLLTVEHKP